MLFVHAGTVSGEMFGQMQNSKIIIKMTEEFDEVTCLTAALDGGASCREWKPHPTLLFSLLISLRRVATIR